jgi:hypothetical protein
METSGTELFNAAIVHSGTFKFLDVSQSCFAVYPIDCELKSEILKDHIIKLKEPYRSVIEMREIQKMAYKDIADKLGRNLSTIKSQIRNGRAILISESERQFEVLDDMYL